MATRLTFRRAAFRELRTLPAVRADIAARARRVAQAAGPGVEVLPIQEPRNRARAVVAPVTPEAAARVAQGNDLIRALEAGR